MRKAIIGMATAIAVFGSCSVQAQHRHYHHGGGGGNWVAPLIGGMVLGGALYGLSQPRAYAAPPVYVDQPAYRRECWLEPQYDYYGRYLGERRQCRVVPIY